MQIGPYWTSNPGQNGTKLQMFLAAPGAFLHMRLCILHFFLEKYVHAARMRAAWEAVVRLL